MRLIDADELKYCHITKAVISPMGCAMTKIINLDNIPTAYDVDEVGERLEDYLFEKYCIEGDAKIDEILKSGGID